MFGTLPVSDAYMQITIRESDKLVYVGKIIAIDPIEGADFIASATVVCGEGGKWKGIVKKSDFEIGSHCIVYLPDSLIPESEYMSFMKSSNWRVKMRRFKGAPSEVLIMPISFGMPLANIGDDVTLHYGVTKYHKPIPAHLQGLAKGNFPDFIPKTDELNYQRYPELVDSLVGKPWYMTEKADGSSTTAFRWKGEFGVCSRNLELVRNPDNGYWKVAEKYKVEENLPEGIAIQWETCGPGIQSNPMGLKDIDGFMFSAYNIEEKRYLTFKELRDLSIKIKFPMIRLIEWGYCFIKDGLELRGEGVYLNGKQREGVVIRSQENYGYAPISFKVINLGFEK
ncbi:MAG: RNA ligase family protein [Candidatus Rhabdochlamydia sp.]